MKENKGRCEERGKFFSIFGSFHFHFSLPSRESSFSELLGNKKNWKSENFDLFSFLRITNERCSTHLTSFVSWLSTSFNYIWYTIHRQRRCYVRSWNEKSIVVHWELLASRGIVTHLCNSEVDNERRVLWIGQWATSGVVTTEVGSTVDDDTLDWYAETAIQSNCAVGLQCLLDTVDQAIVLTICSSLTDISTQAGTCVIQWVDEAEWSCSSSTTGSQVSDEVTPELCLLVNSSQEDLFVDVLEGEVEGLCWEISDDIGQITTPESTKSLLLWNTDETVDDTWRKFCKCEFLRLEIFN